MKIWIIFDSKFGNNKQIAENLAQLLKEGNQAADVHVHYAKTISPKEVIESGIDVFLFGGPLRAGNISFTMKRWALKLADLLQKQHISLKKVAVWGSHSVNAPDTPEKFSWNSSKQKWKVVLDIIPADKKVPEVFGFDVNPKTLEGPLEPGWENIAKQLAEAVQNL
jgi:menaquinone-dependent protoporphyrinogen IX oxidase